MPSVQQELREILDAVEERGFTPRNTDGHYKIYYGDRPVMFKPNPDEDLQVPVTIPGTPSDARWRENLMSTLIKARVLDDDPKKAGQRGLSAEDEERRAQEREERESRQAAASEDRDKQAAEARERAVATARLRERAERVLGRLGVWKTGTRGGSGTRAKRTYREAARVAYAHAEKYDLARPASPSAAEQAMKRLYDQDGGLNDETQEFFSAFLATVEASSDPVAFYFGLLRDLLGLTTDEGEGEPEPPEPQPAHKPSAEPLKIEDEDDARVADLRARLAQKERELDSSRASFKEVSEAAGAAMEAADAALAEAREERDRVLAEAEAATKGVEPRIPELAFEALGEMIGTYISVGSEEDIDAILTLQTQKKEKAVGLAKKIARLELGIAQEDE